MSIRFTSKFHNFVFKNRHGLHFCCRCRGPRNTSTTHKIKLCHKSTKSGFRNSTSECEKCQKLIDIIFGDGKYGNSSTISYQDGPDIQAVDRSKLSQIISQTDVNHETKLQKCQRIISKAFSGMEDNAANEIPTNLDTKIFKAVETEKQNEEKLITKIEKFNEHVELPIHNEKRGPPPNEINIQHSNFSLNKINNGKFDLEDDFIAVTKQCLNVLPEHIDGLILKQLEVFNRQNSTIDERIVPPLSYVVNNIINNSQYNNMLFFKSEGSKGEKTKETVIKRDGRSLKSSPKVQNTEPPVSIPVAKPKVIPTPSSFPSHEKLSPAFQPAITDKPLRFAGMGNYDIDSKVFHMEAFLAPCREVTLDDRSGDKRNKKISEIPTNVKNDNLLKEAANFNFNEDINEKLPIQTGRIGRDLKRHADKGIIENYVSNTNSGVNEEFAKSLQINKREIEKKYNLYMASKNKKENLNLNRIKTDNSNFNDNIPAHTNIIERDFKNRTEHFVSNTYSNVNEEYVKSLQNNKRYVAKMYNVYMASKNKKENFNLNTAKTNNCNMNENNNNKSNPLYNPQYYKPISSSLKPDFKNNIETNAKVNNMESEQNKIPLQNLNIDSTKLASPLESHSDRHQGKTDSNETQVKRIIEQNAYVNNIVSDPKIKSSQYLNMESTKPALPLESDSNIHQSKSDNNQTQVKHIIENNTNVNNMDSDSKIKSSQYFNTKPTKTDSEKHQSKTNNLTTHELSHHTLLPPVFDFRKGIWVNVPEPKKGNSQKNTKLFIDENKHDWLKHLSVDKQNTLQDRTSVSNDNQISAFQPTKSPIGGPVLKDKMYSHPHDGVPSRSKENRRLIQFKNDSNVNFVSDHSKPWLIHPTNRENPPNHISNVDVKEKNKFAKNITNFKSEQTEEIVPLLTKSNTEKKVESENENTSTSNKQDYVINSTNTPKDQTLSDKDEYKFPNISRSCSYTKEDNNIRKWSHLKNENNYNWNMAYRPNTCYQNHYMYNKQFNNPYYKSSQQNKQAQQNNQHTSKDNVKESVSENWSQTNMSSTILHSAIGIPRESIDDDNKKVEVKSAINSQNTILHTTTDNIKESIVPEKLSNSDENNTVLNSAIPNVNKDNEKQDIETNSTKITQNTIASLEKHKEETEEHTNDKHKPELLNNPTSLDAVQVLGVDKHKEETLIDNEKDKMKPELNKITTTVDAVQNILNTNAAHIAPKEEEIDIKAIESLKETPKGEKKISLQQLLKDVRARNRKQAAEQNNILKKETDDTVGKCGDKKPPCPPCPPVCPPPPPPPECPKPCPKPQPKPSCPPEPCGKPKAPCPKKTCFTKLEDKPQIIIVNPSSTSLDLKPVGVDENYTQIPDTTLVKSIGHLKEVLDDCTVIIENIIDDIFTQFNNSFLARSFEPWTPIPSWPIPKADKKRSFICPKEGCKLPVPKMSDQCREKPCQGFPKRER